MLVTIYLWKSDYQWWLVYISYWASGKHWLSTTALSRLHSHIYIYLFSFVLASNILSHYIKFYPLSVTMGSLWLSSKSIQNSVHYHKQLNEFCWNWSLEIFSRGGRGRGPPLIKTNFFKPMLDRVNSFILFSWSNS